MPWLRHAPDRCARHRAPTEDSRFGVIRTSAAWSRCASSDMKRRSRFKKSKRTRRDRAAPPPRPLRLSRRSHSAALPPTTTPHFPLPHECPNRDAQSRSARHHHPDSAPASWIGRRLFRQCLKDTGRAFCWHPETGAGWKLTHGLRAGLARVHLPRSRSPDAAC